MDSSRGAPRWLLPTLMVVAAGVAAFVLASPDEYLGIAQLGLYTVPSHAFISPFPHEPVLLFFSRTHDAWACALASTSGCLVAAVIDFQLVLPWLHRPGVRSRYADLSVYKKSSEWFRKAPFWTLVVSGFTPIPFYPFKFLALAAQYPLHRYMLALIVGRTPRYWSLAYVGYLLQPPNWTLVVLALAIVGLALKGAAKGTGSSKTVSEPPSSSGTLERHSVER